jgi:hypothetical protein
MNIQKVGIRFQRKKYPKISKLKSSLRSIVQQLRIKSHTTIKYWIINELSITKKMKLKKKPTEGDKTN